MFLKISFCILRRDLAVYFFVKLVPRLGLLVIFIVKFSDNSEISRLKMAILKGGSLIEMGDFGLKK